MEQTILTDLQKKALEAVGREPRLVDFYLSGGTALAAYYFRHRLSDDLDFFVFDEPDVSFLHSFADKLKNDLSAYSLRFERLHDRYQFFFGFDQQELKVEFTRYPFIRLEEPMVKNGVRVDSLRDIAANKLMALLDRFDPKDFVDLYFILERFVLENVRTDVEKKFGIKVDRIFLGGELAKVKRIEALPKMIKKLMIPELKNFFTKKADELRPGIFED